MRLLAPKRPPMCPVCGVLVKPIYYEEHTRKCKLFLEINQKIVYLAKHGRSTIDVNDCTLCSRRGLKCDESHPYCLQCQVLGGKCKWWKGRFSHTESSKKNTSFRDFDSHQPVEPLSQVEPFNQVGAFDQTGPPNQAEPFNQVEPLDQAEPFNQIMLPQQNLLPSSHVVPQPELWPGIPDYFTPFEPYATLLPSELPYSRPEYVLPLPEARSATPDYFHGEDDFQPVTTSTNPLYGYIPQPDFGPLTSDYFTDSEHYNTLFAVDYPNFVPGNGFPELESASYNLESTLSTEAYQDAFQTFQIPGMNGFEQSTPLSQGISMTPNFPWYL